MSVEHATTIFSEKSIRAKNLSLTWRLSNQRHRTAHDVGYIESSQYEALCPDYTDDGGHLNKDAARRGALALVQALSQTADKISANK